MEPEHLEQAAIAVLSGADAAAIAARLSLDADDIAAAARTYQTAGQAALTYAATRSPWRHVTIAIAADRAVAAHVGAYQLAPTMEWLREAGEITGWWYLRKATGWRVRYLPAVGREVSAEQHLEQSLTDLAEQDAIDGWTPGIYEPEVEPFGGPAAMDVAHELFSVDSPVMLPYLARPTALGPRELTLLLPTVLARAAGLDWYEQGQLWSDVAAGRPLEAEPDQDAALQTKVRTLLVAAVDPDSPAVAAVAESVAAYTNAGKALGGLAATGQLHRGLRAVCARHVVFAANRLGVSYEDQARLVHAARTVILG